MPADRALERGRSAYAARAWRDAFDQLFAADAEQPLEPEDLDLLATSAYLIGKDAEAGAAWTRAYQRLLEQGAREEAAHAAFMMSLTLLLRGDGAQSSGWLARGQRLAEADGPTAGLLRIPEALPMMWSGDVKPASELFRETLSIGERFVHPDLLAFGRLTVGESSVELGDVAAGVSLLDEAMVSVTTDDVSPIVQGIVYCAVIDLCQRIFDVRRAQEWTSALGDWCESQPDLVPFRGQCLVHRSELMTMRGVWPDAIREADYACSHLSDPMQAALGMAFYQRGELHRLLGEFDQAEHAYRRASEYGHEPQPGMALLRLGEGKPDAAAAAIQRVMAQATDSGPAGAAARLKVLEAFADVMLAAGEIALAREAADELDDIAARFDAPVLRAAACRVLGAVLLAEGDPRGALDRLGAAWTKWKELDAPYEIARTRVLLGLACRALEDADGASMNFDGARATFTSLGAAPDLARLQQLEQPVVAAGNLSAREREVLGLICDGSTNREIANALVISERTVARHLSNIFSKLGVSSRTAAGAYAFKHHLV